MSRAALLVACVGLSAVLVSSFAGARPDASAPPAASSLVDASVRDAQVAVPEASASATLEPIERPAESWPVVEGVVAQVKPPRGWNPADTASLASIDLSQAPGAQMVVSRAWSPSGANNPAPMGWMYLACGSAPSKDWLPGAESIVMDRLRSITTAQLSKLINVESTTMQSIEQQSLGFRQDAKYRGSVGAGHTEGATRVLEEDRLERRPSEYRGASRQLIGFAESPVASVLVCSAACLEPGRGSGVCDEAMSSIRLDGNLSAEPSASWIARIRGGFRAAPWSAVGMMLGALFIVLGAALTLRGLLLPPHENAR